MTSSTARATMAWPRRGRSAAARAPAASATTSSRKARCSRNSCARRTALPRSSTSTRRKRRKSRACVSVLTAADLAAEHYHSLTHAHPIPGRSGKPPFSPHRPALAGDARDACRRAGRHGGRDQPRRRAGRRREGRGRLRGARRRSPMCARRSKPGAPQLWPEAPGNVGFDWTAPADPDGKNQAALDRAFKEAAHVVTVELVNQRLIVASLEPRTATASYDAAAKRFTLRCAHAVVWPRCAARSPAAMNLKPEELHVVTDDVGGAFGMKALGAIPNSSRCCTPRARSASRSIGSRRARRPSSPTTRAATRSGRVGARAQQARPLPRPARRLPRQCRRLFHRRRAFRRDHAHLRLPADGLRHPGTRR